MNTKNYRVIKFFEPVDKAGKGRGYLRLDIRGTKGNIIVSAESLGDAKSYSEVFLYKDKLNKLKLGDINNKKGLIKKSLTFADNNAIEDYNTCCILKDKKIVLYTNLFNANSLEQIKKLEYSEEKIDNNKIDDDKMADNIIAEISEEKKEDISNVPNDENEEINESENAESSEDEAEIKEKHAAHNAEPENYVEAAEDKSENNAVKEAVNDMKNEDRVKKESVDSAVNLKEPDVEAQSRKYRNRFEESLYNALREYKRVEPLSVNIKDIYWWYIPHDESGIKNGFLPYYNQIISSYYPYPISNRVTTCSKLMKKYGHYIFGIYEENGSIERFIYGMPGEFSKEEQPYKGVTGFKNWSYKKDKDEKGYGYWLAFINPKTGESTEPPEIVLS